MNGVDPNENGLQALPAGDLTVTLCLLYQANLSKFLIIYIIMSVLLFGGISFMSLRQTYFIKLVWKSVFICSEMSRASIDRLKI